MQVFHHKNTFSCISFTKNYRLFIELLKTHNYNNSKQGQK